MESRRVDVVAALRRRLSLPWQHMGGINPRFWKRRLMADKHGRCNPQPSGVEAGMRSEEFCGSQRRKDKRVQVP